MRSPVVFFRNVKLTDPATDGQTSTVGEPSVATNADQVFMTGNWYASKSLNNGGSWQFVDPYATLPPADDGFCCDQTAIYVPARDVTVWLLQYVVKDNTNTLRIAVKSGPTLEDDVWHFWDLRPATTNPAWTGEWFDYNHAALSDNFLYVGSNAFTVADDRWTRSVVFRVPLAALAGAGDLTYEYFESVENFSLRCSQGARGNMYIVSHNNLSQMRVFSWPESAAGVTFDDVDVSAWLEGLFAGPGPDGRDWLGRCDSRITGVWVSQGRIGVMWTANAKPPARPWPFVRVVRIDEGTKQVVDEPDLWNAKFAYAYPDAYPNETGDVGITVFRGGGSRHPGHVVGFRDDQANTWRLRATRNGTDGPNDGKWGDYLTCRRHSPQTATWVAVGYTLQGGGARTDVEPRYVHFGRAGS
jgi:hypothetical protein